MATESVLTTVGLVQELCRNSLIGRTRHFSAAGRAKAMNDSLGIPIVLINTALAGVFVVTLTNEVAHSVKWVSALMSLVSAFLGGVHVTQNFSKQFENHRRIANCYLEISRHCERLLGTFNDGLIDLAVLARKLDELADRYDAVNKDAEIFPTRTTDFRKAIKEVSKREKWLAGELDTDR